MKRFLILLAMLTLSLPTFAQVVDCNLVQINGGSTGSTAGKLELKQIVMVPATGQNAIDILVDQAKGLYIHDGGNFGSGIWIQTKFVPFSAISSDNEAAHFRVTGAGAGEPAILVEGSPAGGGTPGAPGILSTGGAAGTASGEEAGAGAAFMGGISSGVGAKAAGAGITVQAGPNDSGNPVAPGHLAVGTDTVFANYWNGVLPTGDVDGISVAGVGDGKGINVTGTTTLGLTLQKNKEHLFAFVMYAANGNPAAGLTVTCTRKLDTGSFAACTNAPTGGTGGAYTVLLSAADMNGEVAVLKLEATGGRTLMIPIVTQN